MSMQTTTNAATPNQEVFNRPPRILKAPPQEGVEIAKPPDREAIPVGQGWLPLLMPVIMMGMMFAIYIFITRASTQQLVFLIPMAMFSIMNPAMAMITNRQRAKVVKRKNRENERKYKKMLLEKRQQLKVLVEEQRQSALSSDPDPQDLVGTIKQHAHLWERRAEDPDFLTARVGKGRHTPSFAIKFPDIDFSHPLMPIIERMKHEFAYVDQIPSGVSLLRAKSLGITGRRQDVAALSRGILCQLATFHSPEDVRLLGIYPASQKQDWDWMRDLPHTVPLKGWNVERLTAVGEDEANMLLNCMLEELSQRASKDAENASEAKTQGIPEPVLPYLVVIVHDYVDIRKHPALTHAFKLGEQLGVSVIYLVAQQQAIPSECRGVIRLSDDRSLTYNAAGFAGEVLDHVVADTIDLEHATSVAVALKSIRVASESEDVAALPANVRLLDLINLPFTDQFDPEKWWGTGFQPQFGMLRVPIGTGISGTVWLDLTENMHGPHGIIAGTTGSGKSELLQSIIVGLAVTHHPHLVNFVLVDFKGGAAFKPFEKIPHTVGMVTDLSGKLTERALVALKSELRRREHVLSAANAKKISEYIMMRSQNPALLEPLPHLFIIIDEFAELAKEHPSFMEGLVSVVQKGRSLGVHLILATQKPTGSVNANIWSNLKFRICLRVASLQDSRDMLGRSEAALLPSTIPGRAYFQIGTEIFEQFQSARISLQARVVHEASLVAKQASIGAGEVTDMKMLMDAMEPFYDTLGLLLFKPWPPPLPRRISLSEVYKEVQRRSPQVVSAGPPYGWLTCPIGVIDRPAEQLQESWMLDMVRGGGHILLGGAAGSGKSVFLRTLITSLVRTHSPMQLHLYLIDFGGQALRVFEKLPHVGGVFGESDEEYVRRLLRKLNGTIDERKQFYAIHQVDDFLTYQRRRNEGGNLPEMPAVILMIDKFSEFKQAHEKEMEALIALARGGRTQGVFLVITVDRSIAVPMQLMSLIEIRIGFRNVELTDSLILLGKSDAATIDPSTPGRAYKRGKVLEEVQVALPVTGEDDDEQTRLLDEMVTQIQQVGKIPTSMQAPPIRLLPEYVRADYFLMDAISHESSGQKEQGKGAQALRLRVGIEDFSLRPINLELSADSPHFLVAGGPGSGRTTFLQTCLLMLACPENRRAKVVLVDFRRVSRPFRRLPIVRMYVDNEDKLTKAIEALKIELRKRVVQIRDVMEQHGNTDEELPTLDLPPIVLMIDDYDQIQALARNPISDLKEFMLQARDLRFHIVVTGTPGDLSRSDVLLQQVRVGRAGIIMGGDPAEQAVFGVRITDLLPGRGYIVRRNQKFLTQVAQLAPETLSPWIHRLIQSSSMHGHHEQQMPDFRLPPAEVVLSSVKATVP